jgi:hypothetical protein
MQPRTHALKQDHHILTSDVFDLVLWLFNTVLQCQERFDFFGARVLMKASLFLAREVEVRASFLLLLLLVVLWSLLLFLLQR